LIQLTAPAATAATLSYGEVPQTLLALADEIIE
jgi:hypothetical protein